MAGENLLGIDCKLYYNSATYATPTWVEINLIENANLNQTWDTGEASTRISRVKQWVKTQLEIGFTFRILKRPTVVGYEQIKDGMAIDTPIDVLILDGATTEIGSCGVRFHALVVQRSQDQSLGAVLYDDCELKPSIDQTANNPPKFAEVTTGPALTFTDFG